MLDILQFVVGNGFWQFVGGMFVFALMIHGVIGIIRAILKVPEYPQKCPRCGFDNDATDQDDEMLVKLSSDVEDTSDAGNSRRRNGRGKMYDGGWKWSDGKKR